MAGTPDAAPPNAGPPFAGGPQARWRRGLAVGALVLGSLLSAACQTTERPLVGPRKVTGWTDGESRAVPSLTETLGEVGTPPMAGRSGLFDGTGLDPADAAAGDPDRATERAEPQGPGGQEPQDPEVRRRQQEAAIRARFGSTVLIGADGRVTKQYQMLGEVGTVFRNLCKQPPDKLPSAEPMAIGGEGATSILGRMLGGSQVEVVYLEGFSTIPTVELRESGGRDIGRILPRTETPNFDKGTRIDLALITAEPSALLRFEDSLNLFYGRMPQVEIKVEVVEFTNNDALNFGVQQVGNAPLLENSSSNQLVQSFTSSFPLRSPLVGGNPITDLGVFTLGGIHDTWTLNAQLEALEANSSAEIASSPTLVVRNGGIATIETITDFPFPRAQITTNGNQVSADIQFKPVGVTMKILPIIAGTDTIILQVAADVSAVTGFADTAPVDTPIIANRSATTTVQLRNQQSLVIGGLISKSTFESESKVPILGDIPLLGFLFRSTSIQHNDTSLSFIITPTIKMGTEDM